jgi:hypothetical protein
MIRSSRPAAPAWLRWIMCEAAQTAKRHPDFAATYQATARRRGKKIATTAIARKLLARAYHLLTDATITAPQAPAATTGTAPASHLQIGKGQQAPGKLVKPHEPATPRSMT